MSAQEHPGLPDSSDSPVPLTDGGTWQYRAIVGETPGPWAPSAIQAAAPALGYPTPLEISASWRIFGPFGGGDEPRAPWGAPVARDIPNRLTIAGQCCTAADIPTDAEGRLDIASCIDRPERNCSAVVATTFELPEASDVTLHLSADWFMQVWLDGREIIDTFSHGNYRLLFERAFPMRLQLDAGEHVLAARIVGGSGGWSFAAEATRWSPPTDPATGPITIEAALDFDVAAPADWASLTLEGDPQTEINGRAPTPPLDGMTYRRLRGIDTQMLSDGANRLTRRWTLEPDERERLAPLTHFKASGPGEPIAADARLLAVPAEAARIDAGPYITIGPEGRRVVTCRTDATVPVQLDVDGQPPQRSEAGIWHGFDLDAPPADTDFSLSPAGKDLSRGVRGRLRTERDDGTVRVIVAGDAGPLPEVWRTVATSIHEERPDVLVFVGDHVGNGLVDAFWDEQFTGPAAELLASTCMLPVPGNHDIDSPRMWQSWPVRRPGERHWTVALGATRLIGLEGKGDWTPDGPDAGWLEGTLADVAEPFVFVFNHYPPYSSGVHTRTDADGLPVEPEVRTARDVILPICQRHGVRALFSGHDHAYERFMCDGLAAIISAGAGAFLYDDYGRDRPENPPRPARASGHHYVILDCCDETVMLRALTPQGETLDEYRWE
jgi:hypothetical protein